MRRFEFEAEMYETLSCLPTTVRKNLDRTALKISHKQWLALKLKERRQIREIPGDTDSQLHELADFIWRLVFERYHEQATLMSAAQQRAALPPAELPANLAANARGLGIEPTRNH